VGRRRREGKEGKKTQHPCKTQFLQLALLSDLTDGGDQTKRLAVPCCGGEPRRGKKRGKEKKEKGRRRKTTPG